MRRLLHWVGALLCVAAVALFAREIMTTGLALPRGGATRAVGSLAAASVAYALGVGLLAMLWSALLLDRGAKRDTRAEVVSGYLVSQFGKYLPGNVFQYVGRHALGRRLGLPHSSLISAAIHETVLLAAAAVVVAAACVATMPGHLDWLRPAMAAAGVAGLLLLFAAPRIVSRLAMLPGLNLGRYSLLTLGYLAFVVLFSLLYWICLRLFGAGASLPDAVGSAALGWVAGFLVPGAPAGVGLREATLALTLDGDADGAAVSSAIVAFRIVTMLGDFIAFIAGLAMRRGQLRPED